MTDLRGFYYCINGSRLHSNRPLRYFMGDSKLHEDPHFEEMVWYTRILVMCTFFSCIKL